MSTFLDWNDGNQFALGDTSNPTPIASNAPYVWSADGSFLDRWPTNLGTVPDGQLSGRRDLLQPTAATSTTRPGRRARPRLPGHRHRKRLARRATTARATSPPPPTSATSSSRPSGTSSRPGGQLSAPGSVYDNDTEAGTVGVASKTPGRRRHPREPDDQAGDPLQIPAVSSDGSHILMAAGGTGPCGFCQLPGAALRRRPSAIALRCPMQPSHLYMRVDGAVTYDVSQGHDVDYVGMTADGSKVYFTTAQQLTPEDTDTSVDLYMWSEATDSLTLVSKGNNGAGNSDSCSASFATQVRRRHLFQPGSTAGSQSGQGGNCLSDNSIASQNGDIYFFSPEQLDGARGIPNQENLYVYRNGAGSVRHHLHDRLRSAPAARSTTSSDDACSDTPIAQDAGLARRQPHGVRHRQPGDRSTTTRATSRCTPTNPPPARSSASPASPAAHRRPQTSTASQDGLFMTDDGRAFFTTDDALVHSDTNNGLGRLRVRRRPSAADHARERARRVRQAASSSATARASPGSSGSAPTAATSTSRPTTRWSRQDHNGLFLKFYDARAGGGFPAPAAAAALRRRRRVPRRRQPAAVCRSRTAPAPPSAPAATPGRRRHRQEAPQTQARQAPP